MRYAKLVGLLAIAAAALMAVAASAAATTITSPTNTKYTSTIHATTEGNPSHVVLENPIASIQCHSTLEGKIENHGPGLSATGEILNLLWGTKGNLNGACTNSWHVTTVIKGRLLIHWKAEHEGTLTLTETKFDATRFGVTCVYQMNNTEIGTITDSHKTGKTVAPYSTATLHVNAQVPLITSESGALCGGHLAKWEGSFLFEGPDKLYIDEN